MVAFFFPIQLGGSLPILIWDTKNAASSIGGNDYKVTAMPIGPAGTKKGYIAVHWKAGSSARTISSATIGGLAATIEKQAAISDGSSNSIGVGIISVSGSLGATVDVIVTMSGAVSGILLGSFYGKSSVTNDDNASATRTDGSNPSVNVNVANNGAVLSATSFYDTGITNVTLGNVDRQYYDQSQIVRAAAGFRSDLTANASYSVTTGQSGASGTYGAAIVAISLH